MKIKQHLMICDPQAFAKGDFFSCLNLYGKSIDVSEWIDCGEVELTINVSEEKLVATSIKTLDKQEAKLREEFAAALGRIETERANLRALTYQPADDEPAAQESRSGSSIVQDQRDNDPDGYNDMTRELGIDADVFKRQAE